MKRSKPSATEAPLSATRERAAALAQAIAPLPFLHSPSGPATEHDLLALVTQELGHAEALDRFVALQSHLHGHTLQAGGHLSRATPLSPLLHIVSGNTPHAALQSLLRGLLLGAHNRCKLPSRGELPEVAQFLAALPPTLASRVEVERHLPAAWLSEAEAVIVFGSDATIAHFHAQLRPDQRFIAHGHKISLGVLLTDPDPDSSSAPTFARDIALYEQLGCLSPQVLYVAGETLAREYAAKLAHALEAEEQRTPHAPRPLEAQRAIHAFREEHRFRAALNPAIQLWASSHSTAWTLLLDPDPHRPFPFTPLYRTIIVKPLPSDTPPAEALQRETAAIRPHLSTIALHPYTPEHAQEIALATGAPRLCPFGAMQFPSPFWHHDGEAVLQPLVRWQDLDAIKKSREAHS